MPSSNVLRSIMFTLWASRAWDRHVSLLDQGLGRVLRLPWQGGPAEPIDRSQIFPPIHVGHVWL
jgi:hypothetical protein